jgi:hypothetical protein
VGQAVVRRRVVSGDVNVVVAVVVVLVVSVVENVAKNDPFNFGMSLLPPFLSVIKTVSFSFVQFRLGSFSFVQCFDRN